MPTYAQEPSGKVIDRSNPKSIPSRELLEPLVDQWLSMVEAARKGKEGFNMIAYQCDSFFSKQSGFMWQDAYKNDYIGKDIQAPKFCVTINKAFELVALFGPYLFWKYPQVFIQTPEQLELTPELFGDPNDEQVQQMFQQTSAQQQSELAPSKMRNKLMEMYLNYAQREQPGGGLKAHVEVAITEALVKGRSCLWIESYQAPGSDRNLTQCKWRSVDDLLIDPDSRDPFLSDAKYIILEHDDDCRDLEKKFDLPKDYLKGRGDYSSKGNNAAHRTTRSPKDAAGQRDRKVWYEIWSKCGIGTRISGEENRDQMISTKLHDAFDDSVGEYAYLCVTDGVRFPLNAPTHMFKDENNNPKATDEEVQEMFAWRAPDYGPSFPCYADNRWPVALLDFYRTYNSCWPIAPLAPALGELTILNILAAAFTEQAYENRKSIIAYLEEEAKTLKTALESNANPVLVPIANNATRKISDMIQYLNRPEMNGDLREAIGFVERLFEQRTGLNEFMYAMQQTQDRTARGTAAKEEKASIRPEKMAGDVADFLTQAAELAKFLAGWTVVGEHLTPLFGSVGAQLWDQLIANEDPEIVVREMRCTVQAADHRKPNQERLLANMQQSLQFLLPVLQEYAGLTGDSGPLNEFMESMNRAMEDKIMPQFGPYRPEPDEKAQQMQEMQMQLEMAKLQAEVQAKQMDIQAKSIDAQKAQVELQITANSGEIEAERLSQQLQGEVATRQLELTFAQQEASQTLMLDATSHEQELIQDQQTFEQDMAQKRAEAALKIAGMRVQTDIKLDSSKQQADIKVKQAKSMPKPKAPVKK